VTLDHGRFYLVDRGDVVAVVTAPLNATDEQVRQVAKQYHSKMAKPWCWWVDACQVKRLANSNAAPLPSSIH
jgi:hypothetical protein